LLFTVLACLSMFGTALAYRALTAGSRGTNP
jgi:hypothetical protein